MSTRQIVQIVSDSKELIDPMHLSNLYNSVLILMERVERGAKEEISNPSISFSNDIRITKLFLMLHMWL